MQLSRIVASVLIAVCATTIGCGGGPDLPPAYPVTGKVTVQGAPLAGYLISFVPQKGDGGASATVGSDGSYSLSTFDGRPGCTLGKYKVVLNPGLEAAQAAMKNVMSGAKGPPKVAGSKIPEPYRSAVTSPKEVEVKAEPNVIEIAI